MTLHKLSTKTEDERPVTQTYSKTSDIYLATLSKTSPLNHLVH